MAKTVSHLVRFIFDGLNNQDAPKTAFYNYLRACFEPDEVFTSGHAIQFVLDALHHPQWQAQKAELVESVAQIVAGFQKAGYASGMNVDEIKSLANLQTIRIQNSGELYKIVKSFEESRLKEAATLRVLPDGEERMVTMTLEAQGQLYVRTYDRNVYIQNGQLRPLPPEQQLVYSGDLDLLRDCIHWIRTPDHSMLRFRVSDKGVKGVLLSGATFKSTQTFDSATLVGEKQIFYSIKRLERFYIHRQTDPFYNEVLSLLERAIEAIRLNSTGNAPFARKAFATGQEAFENIFPDDKTLYRLLRELATTLTLKGVTLGETR